MEFVAVSTTAPYVSSPLLGIILRKLVTFVIVIDHFDIRLYIPEFNQLL